MPTNTGDAILSTLSALDRAGASIANTVEQYQRIQAASIVVNKQADYNRAKNSIAASIQGDTSLSPDQWLDEWNQRSQDFRNIYADEKNPIARQALQQMVDSGDEQVRAQFENTKAQWYKSQARVNCANGIQAGIDAGDYQQINANLATYQSLADSPEQFEQVKTSAANSYLMTTALAQLTDEMRANGKESADVMYDHSDFAVTMFDGTRHELTPTLKGQLKGQLDSAWADFAKQNDDGLGHNAANMLVSVNTEQAANQYLGAVAKMKFVDGDEKWKWYSRGQEMLRTLKEGGSGNSKEEDRVIGEAALASVSLDTPAQYYDFVQESFTNGKIPGGKVESVLNYWKKDDAILKGELDRIASWKTKDKNGKQIMSDAAVATIAGLTVQYRNTPGNEGLTADKIRDFVDTLTNKELAKTLFQPKRLTEKFDPKNVDAQEAAISMFQGGYIGWMQEHGVYDTWREAMGLPKTATAQALKSAVEQRATELMTTDYRSYMGKAADHAKIVAAYIDTGNGLPTVTVDRAGTDYARDGDTKATVHEKYVLKIMTNADYAGNSDKFARLRYRPSIGEETWFKVETDQKGNTVYQYWAPAGHASN